MSMCKVDSLHVFIVIALLFIVIDLCFSVIELCFFYIELCFAINLCSSTHMIGLFGLHVATLCVAFVD